MVTPVFFDSHCHFPLSGDTPGILARAREAGVAHVLAIGCDPETNTGAVAAFRAAPQQCFLARGYDYSTSGSLTPDNAIQLLKPFVKEGRETRLSCVGEIGLDTHWENADMPAQQALFEAQLRFADSCGLPVSVHTREADAETLRSLDAVPQKTRKGLRGVIHCYTGGMEFARELLARTFAISFSGIVTFRNADPLRAVAAEIPEDRLLIETDSPYLAPVPMRGKRNEPAFVPLVAACLAAVRNTDCARIAEVTARNALALFQKDLVVFPKFASCAEGL